MKPTAVLQVAPSRPARLEVANANLGNWMHEVSTLRHAMNATAEIGRKNELAKLICVLLAESGEVFLDFTKAVPQ